ncbi:MAG: hypothetical protein KatS3mg030_083 [Saprospiraceae bacterium]|nr:MAG: hypothetical protein KatS3mg030_083 [Saprospiraceae bacterium]
MNIFKAGGRNLFPAGDRVCECSFFALVTDHDANVKGIDA